MKIMEMNNIIKKNEVSFMIESGIHKDFWNGR